MMLLMTIDKFDHNLVLVNINKLKPCRFVEDHTLQPIIVKNLIFITRKLVETNHFGNLFIKEPFEINYFANLFPKFFLKKPIIMICSLKNQFG
jgi:hypothetical protein